MARLYLFGPQLSSKLHATMLSVGVAMLVLIFGLAPWLDFFLYFGFVIFVSIVVYRRVETPMRKWIAGRERERSHPVAVAAMAG